MNNFTPLARQVLALSRKEADRFIQKHTGGKRLRTGIVSLRQRVAAAGLRHWGVILSSLRSIWPGNSTASCTVNFHMEILSASGKLGMILDESIEHLHKLHYSEGDTPA